jgi:hypothetical protein
MMSVLYTVPRRRRVPRFAFAKTGNRRSIEALVLEAYLKLVRVAWNEGGSRAMLLAKYGQYEVRLFERMSAGDADCPHLWVELYAHDMQTSIDACGCDDVEAAAIAAEDIMCQARQLEEGERLARSAARKTSVG